MRIKGSDDIGDKTERTCKLASLDFRALISSPPLASGVAKTEETWREEESSLAVWKPTTIQFISAFRDMQAGRQIQL